MRNIVELIFEVCENSHVPMAQEVFGDEGVSAVFKVTQTVKTLYRHLEPERLSGEVLVFQVVGPAGAESSFVGQEADFVRFANTPLSGLCLEVVPDGRVYVRELG